MPKQKSLFDVRYVIMITKEEAEKWDDTDFILVTSAECWISDDYVFALIQPVIEDEGYTAEDVLEITGAVAAHEEYTHGIITDIDNLEKLNDIYCWSGSGGCLLYDMLTETEKLALIMNHFYIKTKERVEISDLYITLEKDQPKIPIEGNITKLFTNEVIDIIHKDDSESLWGAFLIAESGYFLVVIDPALEDDVELENLKPDNLWGDWYDDYEDEYDYHYIDKYCRNKGLL